MTQAHLNRAEARARQLARSGRRQALAAAVLSVCSMFSPAPDLRPKPLLPVRYQMVRPADPPKPDFDRFAAPSPRREPAAPGIAIDSCTAPAALPPYHPFRSEAAKARYLALHDKRASEWPVPCESVRAVGAFGETFVRVSGPRNAPPLMLLHGISSNSLAWMPNIAALASTYRVYAVDHIQDGGRSVPTRALENLADQLAWLDGLFDALGLAAGVNLVGLSYGGWLAAQYASARPRRLARLVLIAPAGTVLPLATEWIVRAVACAIPLRCFTRSFLQWLLHDLAQRPATERPRFEDIVTEAYTTLRCLAPRAMVPPTVMSDEALRALAMPALYLVGQNEKICPPLQAIARLQAAAPRITTRLIAGAGHDLTLVKAAEVNHAILDFLAAA
jgi:pimeloyl-ACP methyl ester carboxylesterase